VLKGIVIQIRTEQRSFTHLHVIQNWCYFEEYLSCSFPYMVNAKTIKLSFTKTVPLLKA